MSHFIMTDGLHTYSVEWPIHAQCTVRWNVIETNNLSVSDLFSISPWGGGGDAMYMVLLVG